MKVLHVYKTYYPEDFTGVPRVIHAICEGAADMGVESAVLALTRDSASPEPIMMGRHVVHQVKRDMQIASADFALGAFAAFRRLAAQADIVNYHFPWPTADLLWMEGGRRRPSVITYHSDIVKQKNLLRFYAPLRDRFLSGADAIVATSPNYAASSPVLDFHKSKTQVIPIGIAPREHPGPERVGQWRERLGERFFLFVGSERYYKGTPYLIAAAAQTGLPVVMVGHHAGKAALPSNVTVLGTIEDADKEALLELCLAFVCSSHLRAEAFGVALLEAARAGKPLISCEIGTGTSFVNADGVSGLVVPPADASSLGAAMQRLSADAALAARLGAGAAARYAALFTRDRMARAYVDLYDRVVQSGAGRGAQG